MNKRFLLLTIIILMTINLNINAQQDLQKLINEFKSSIELPEYHKGKQLMSRTPYEVYNMHIENGILAFEYTSGNQSYKNCYSVEIDLKKTKIEKGTGYNYNTWFTGSGNIVVRKTGNESENILVDWFTFVCKSESMRERVYNELVSMQIPFKPQTKATSEQKKSPNTPLKKGSLTRSVSKKSKSGKYEQ